MARKADTARTRTSTRTSRRGTIVAALAFTVGLAAAGSAAAATPAKVTDGTSNTVIFAEAHHAPDGIIAVLIGL